MIYAFFSICFYILQVLSQRRDGAPAARPGTDGAPAARPGTDQCIIKIKNVKKTQLTEDQIQLVCKSFADAKGSMFLGRGFSYPIALEGALKLKELVYVHAEGYPAGEMKHGPLALIENGMPVVVLAPRDEYFKKTK